MSPAESRGRSSGRVVALDRIFFGLFWPFFCFFIFFFFSLFGPPTAESHFLRRTW
ncbi:hypothetical protein BDV26DRAFT_254534 [Aspergillus bertholletiae]|uniref:Uncharacterized protein n=1 Tax=Aspergillus bertholletiae TaxID=1226010 RepID=A0A5N7BJH5_9EURO|nr:hypothetical protein BDV26DRAFT_254534 [Aspergillus bertholletiae]